MTAVLLDALTGLLVTGLLVLFAIYSFSWRGMGTLFAAAGLLFLSAGFLRGNAVPAYPGLKALLLISAYVIFYTLIRAAPLFMLAMETVIAFGSSIGGIYARRKWTGGARRRSVFILAAVLGLVEIASAFGAPMLAKRLTTRTGDAPAAEFSRRVDSAQFKGRIAVLYFWATWCPPCWQEFPKLEKLYERYELNPDVVFLAIDAGGRGETPAVAKSFVDEGGYTIPAAFDDRGAAAHLRIGVYPSLLLLDRNWHVRLVHAGYDGSEHYVENISREIDRLLAE